MPWLERIIAREPALPLRPYQAYPAAALMIGAAYAVRVALGPMLVGVPFITFFPAVFGAAVLGGLAPGILATVLALFLFWLAPLELLGDGLDWEQTSGLAFALFAAVSLLFCVTVHGFYCAVERLRETRRREGALLLDLERRVADRTQTTGGDERAAAARNRRAGESRGRCPPEPENADDRAASRRRRARLQQPAHRDHRQYRGGATTRGGARPGHRPPRLAQALRGAERAATLTQRLLAFARQQPLAPAAVDVNRLITAMSDLIRRTLGAQIAIETVLAGGLWRTRCDANQLEVALLNLVINGRDAMPEGGKLTIESANAHLDQAYADQHEEVAPGQYVMVAVTDTGTGMSKQIIERAFDPFFTTKAPGEGTGLGLSMVYGFVKQSGGHVKIYSEPGHGTSIKIYLPRLADEHETTAPTRESAATAQPERAAATCTVLVVEDEPDVRAFTVQTLTELGYRVCEAPDGPEAMPDPSIRARHRGAVHRCRAAEYRSARAGRGGPTPACRAQGDLHDRLCQQLDHSRRDARSRRRSVAEAVHGTALARKLRAVLNTGRTG